MTRIEAKTASGNHLRLNGKKGAGSCPFFFNYLGTSQQAGRQQAGGPFFVRLYPGLSVAALRAGLGKELALWCELRAINVTHMGKLPLEDAVAALVKHFDYTPSTAYRLLQAGRGKLWDWDTKDPLPYRAAARATNAKHSYSDVPTVRSSQPGRGQGYYSTREWHSVVKIKGLYRVAEYLDTLPGRPVEVKASHFRGRQAKTAQLYASFFKPDGVRAKPISRDSISAATGVKRRQQRRYDKVAGIKRAPNFACYQDSQGKLAVIRHLVYGKSRQWLKDRRLGNTYHSRALKAPRGMTKRINAEFRHRSLISGEMACVLKRFFLTPQTFIKCKERDNEAFLRVRVRDRVIPGRMEWCMV